MTLQVGIKTAMDNRIIGVEKKWRELGGRPSNSNSEFRCESWRSRIKGNAMKMRKTLSRRGWKFVGVCKKGWYKLRTSLKIWQKLKICKSNAALAIKWCNVMVNKKERKEDFLVLFISQIQFLVIILCMTQALFLVVFGGCRCKVVYVE